MYITAVITIYHSKKNKRLLLVDMTYVLLLVIINML